MVFGKGDSNIVARVERVQSPVVPFCRGREGDNTFNGFVLSNSFFNQHENSFLGDLYVLNRTFCVPAWVDQPKCFLGFNPVGPELRFRTPIIISN